MVAQSHQAYSCFCGSARFNLIYDGSIECDACGFKHPWRHDVEVAEPVTEKDEVLPHCGKSPERIKDDLFWASWEK